jgi:hypothetical protein
MNLNVVPFAELKIMAKRPGHEADYSLYLFSNVNKCECFSSTIPVHLTGVQLDAGTTSPVNS